MLHEEKKKGYLSWIRLVSQTDIIQTMNSEWERDEWWLACDDTPVRRFAGGIEIVGDAEDAEDEGEGEGDDHNI